MKRLLLIFAVSLMFPLSGLFAHGFGSGAAGGGSGDVTGVNPGSNVTVDNAVGPVPVVHLNSTSSVYIAYISSYGTRFEEIALATAGIVSGAADNFGTHVATKDVDMAEFLIKNATGISNNNDQFDFDVNDNASSDFRINPSSAADGTGNKLINTSDNLAMNPYVAFSTNIKSQAINPATQIAGGTLPANVVASSHAYHSVNVDAMNFQTGTGTHLNVLQMRADGKWQGAQLVSSATLSSKLIDLEYVEWVGVGGSTVVVTTVTDRSFGKMIYNANKSSTAIWYMSAWIESTDSPFSMTLTTFSSVSTGAVAVTDTEIYTISVATVSAGQVSAMVFSNPISFTIAEARSGSKRVAGVSNISLNNFSTIIGGGNKEVVFRIISAGGASKSEVRHNFAQIKYQRRI